MHLKIVTERLVIREFTRTDAEALYRIVREKNILRFMADWIAGTECPLTARMRLLAKQPSLAVLSCLNSARQSATSSPI